MHLSGASDAGNDGRPQHRSQILPDINGMLG